MRYNWYLASRRKIHGTFIILLIRVLFLFSSANAEHAGITLPKIGQEFLVHIDVEIDLSEEDLYGAVSEESEESPGAYIHYNIDNDNGNTQSGNPIADKDDSGIVSGENDLKNATIVLDPVPDTGKVVLSRSNNKIRVWKSQAKGEDNDVLTGSSQKIWDLSNPIEKADFNSVKNNLWVEGYQYGGSDLIAEYKGSNDSVICSDAVKNTFIGAVCGYQPKPDQRTRFNSWFPNLVHCEWSITGGETNSYNCIAWSTGETSRWYNPQDIDREYGDNDGIFENSDMDAFYLIKKSWRPTASGANDAKAMYYPYASDWDYISYPDDPPGSGYHGAKKKGCNCGSGKWIMFESKCGGWEKIEHVWDQLNGSSYGSAQRFYK